jgi:hypothetical protein
MARIYHHHHISDNQIGLLLFDLAAAHAPVWIQQN